MDQRETRARILAVAPQPFYTDRGSPIAVRQVIAALSELSYEVDILTYPIGKDIGVERTRHIRPPNPLSIRSVPVGFSLRKVFFDLFLTAKARRLLRSRRYAAIHAVEEMIVPCILLGRRYGVPVVYDMQSSIPEQLKDHPIFGRAPVQRLMKRVERWALREADFVVSSAGLGVGVPALQEVENRSEWIFPSDLEPADAAASLELRRRHDIPESAPVVLYAGTFAGYQGLPLLLEAIPHVLSAHPEAVFVLVGAHEGDGRLIERHGDPGSRASVRVVERQPRQAMPEYYEMAHLLVSPRLFGNNLPLKIFDYLMSGRPILATELPTHRSVLNDEIAVLVEPSPSAIAEGINHVLGNPELAARLSAGARGFAAETLTWEGFVRSVSEIYQRATASG